MPRRPRVGHRKHGDGLTITQREILTDSCPILGIGRAFNSDTEAREAWKLHREGIMVAFGADHPGQRPAGWWCFDLGMLIPPTWWKQVAELERRGLIDRDEEFRLGRRHRILAADQGPYLFGPHTIGPMYKVCSCNRDVWERNRPGKLRADIEQSAFAAGWHDRRGRVGLTAKYRQRVEALMMLLDEVERMKEDD